MLVIRIEDELIAQKLRLRAEQEQRGVDELVSEMLTHSLGDPQTDDSLYGSGEHLAQIVERANIKLDLVLPEHDIDAFIEQEYENDIVQRTMGSLDS